MKTLFQMIKRFFSRLAPRVNHQKINMTANSTEVLHYNKIGFSK